MFIYIIGLIIINGCGKKFVDADMCTEQYKHGTDLYNECMKNANIVSLLKATPNDLKMTDLCRLFIISENCVEKGGELIKNCSTLIQKQLANHLAGLRAFKKYECERETEDEERSEQILACEKEQKNEHKRCDKKLNYTYTEFLPLPVLKAQYSRDMWTDQDCRMKFRWADCWIQVYGKCESKAAKGHYGGLFFNVLRSYPACRQLLKNEMDEYVIVAEAHFPTLSYFVLCISALVYLNL